MIKIPDSVLILYIIVSVLGFCLRFFKDSVYKQLSFKPLLEKGGLFLLALLPFIALLFLAQQFSVSAGSTIPYFAGAACLSYLLWGIGLPSYLRGILLSGAALALSLCLNLDYIPLAAALSGLLLVKLTENIAFGTGSELDDVLPPLIWLSSVMWITSVESGQDIGTKAGLILGIMAVSIFMRFVQGPFVAVGKPNDDKLLVKRVVLSATAGLGVLIIIVKLLNLMAYQNLALICGAAYFIVYLYKDQNGDERYSLGTQQALRLLIYVGVLTLVSRLYGNLGILALAPAAMVAPLSSAALLPGIYFASRALLQVYLQHFNLNVTGINLTHTYVGAAQYGGFLFAVVMILLFREKMKPTLLLALVLAACLVSPVLANFILHAEATCSLFSAALLSCFLLAVAAPALQNGKSNGLENISLAPALLISSGILTSGLLELGNTTNIALKTTVMSWAIVFAIAFVFIFWFFFQRPKRSDGPEVKVDGA